MLFTLGAEKWQYFTLRKNYKVTEYRQLNNPLQLRHFEHKMICKYLLEIIRQQIAFFEIKGDKDVELITEQQIHKSRKCIS